MRLCFLSVDFYNGHMQSKLLSCVIHVWVVFHLRNNEDLTEPWLFYSDDFIDDFSERLPPKRIISL